jgi:hypothetical protein
LSLHTNKKCWDEDWKDNRVQLAYEAETGLGWLNLAANQFLRGGRIGRTPSYLATIQASDTLAADFDMSSCARYG